MLPIGKTWGKAVEHGGELDVTSGDLTHLFWWCGTKGGPQPGQNRFRVFHGSGFGHMLTHLSHCEERLNNHTAAAAPDILFPPYIPTSWGRAHALLRRYLDIDSKSRRRRLDDL